MSQAPQVQVTPEQVVQTIQTFQQYLHSIRLSVHLSPVSAAMAYAAGSAVTVGVALLVELVIVMGWVPRSPRAARAAPARAGPFRVTVIVPTYREGDSLVRTLESVVSQDYPRDLLEVVVAGEAGDETLGPALARLGLKAEDGFAGRVSGVTVKVSLGQGARGKPAALNRALELATGDVIGVVDADEALPPDGVRRAVEALASGFAAAQLPRALEVPPEARRGLGKVHVRGQAAEMQFYNRLLAPSLVRLTGSAWLTGSSYFVWRSDLEDVGAWTPWAPTEDLDLSVKLLAAGKRIAFVGGAPSIGYPLTSVRSILRQKERWVRGSLLATFRALRGIRRTWPLVLFFIMPAWGYLLTPWLGLLALSGLDLQLLRWTLLWSLAWLAPSLAYYAGALRRAGREVRPLPAIMALYLLAGLASLAKIVVSRSDWRGSRA